MGNAALRLTGCTDRRTFAEKQRSRRERSALQSAGMWSRSISCVFAAILFGLPAALLSRVNTERKEELRVAVAPTPWLFPTQNRRWSWPQAAELFQQTD